CSSASGASVSAATWKSSGASSTTRNDQGHGHEHREQARDHRHPRACHDDRRRLEWALSRLSFRFGEPGLPKTCDALVAGPTAEMVATPGFCDPKKYSLRDSQEAHFTGPGHPTKKQLMKKYPGVRW